MTPEQILKLYDAKYAREYDEKFLTSEVGGADAEYEVQMLKRLLADGGPWLDVACGTGYFLSLFPQVERAGLDLSPDMLAVAARRNQNVVFFQQNYLDRTPEWANHWKLVSCMWYAYGFVSTMVELEQLIENLARWTAPDGICFVPLCDPVLLSGVPIPYDVSGSPWPGRVLVTGITWSYFEQDGSKHEHIMAPHIDHMKALFGAYFEQIDLITYPSTRPGLLARRKRKTRSVETGQGDRSANRGSGA